MKPEVTIREARIDDMACVAHLQFRLHRMEGGTSSSSASTAERAAAYLMEMRDATLARCFVAEWKSMIVGCIVLEFSQFHADLATAGGLVCERIAPAKTALALMSHAARVLANMDIETVWLVASTDKNRRRATYRKLGFRPAVDDRGHLHMVASVGIVRAEIRKRLGGEEWGA
jgi:hypothetical protein